MYLYMHRLMTVALEALWAKQQASQHHWSSLEEWMHDPGLVVMLSLRKAV